MQILRSKKFIKSLKEIVRYISKDSKERALSFIYGLDEVISDIPFMPRSHRKSIYFNNENIRDLIYKGYTVAYKIDENNKQITIIGIKKYKENI